MGGAVDEKVVNDDISLSRCFLVVSVVMIFCLCRYELMSRKADQALFHNSNTEEGS
jgi:hypothetical protein